MEDVADLPVGEEVAMMIISFLPIDEIPRAALVCRRWARLARDSALWARICVAQNGFVAFAPLQRDIGLYGVGNLWFALLTGDARDFARAISHPYEFKEDAQIPIRSLRKPEKILAMLTPREVRLLDVRLISLRRHRIIEERCILCDKPVDVEDLDDFTEEIIGCSECKKDGERFVFWSEDYLHSQYLLWKDDLKLALSYKSYQTNLVSHCENDLRCIAFKKYGWKDPLKRRFEMNCRTVTNKLTAQDEISLAKERRRKRKRQVMELFRPPDLRFYQSVLGSTFDETVGNLCKGYIAGDLPYDLLEEAAAEYRWMKQRKKELVAGLHRKGIDLDSIVSQCNPSGNVQTIFQCMHDFIAHSDGRDKPVESEIEGAAGYLASCAEFSARRKLEQTLETIVSLCNPELNPPWSESEEESESDTEDEEEGSEEEEEVKDEDPKKAQMPMEFSVLKSVEAMD